MFFQNLSRLISLHALLLLLKFLFDEILFAHLLSFQDFESFSFADEFLLVNFDSYFFINWRISFVNYDSSLWVEKQRFCTYSWNDFLIFFVNFDDVFFLYGLTNKIIFRKQLELKIFQLVFHIESSIFQKFILRLPNLRICIRFADKTRVFWR